MAGWLRIPLRWSILQLVTGIFGQTFTHYNSGVLSSSNYPDPYPDNESVSWRLIVQEPGKVMQLEITDFHLEDGYDFLSIYEGASPNVALFNYTGVRGHKVLRLHSNHVIVKFSSDDIVATKGFRIQFSSQAEQADRSGYDSGGYIRTFRLFGTGDVLTPGFPEQYHNNITITWFLRAQSGKAVQLQIINFETKECCDLLRVYNGYSTTQEPVHTFSGIMTAFSIILRGSEAVLVFTTDFYTTYRGFYIRFLSYVSEGYTLSMRSFSPSEIQTPNYPSPYGNNVKVTWYLSADPQKMVRLQFNDMRLGQFDDSLLIYEGNQMQIVHSRYTRSHSFGILYLKSNYAILVFQSDSETSSQGFSITFSSYIPLNEEPTNYTMTWSFVGSGNVSAPKFPRAYVNNARLTWHLRAEQQKFVRLQLIQFRLERNDDVLYVYEGNQTKIIHSKFTGNTRPCEVNLQGSFAIIIFISGKLIVDTGFNIHFTSYSPLPSQLPGTQRACNYTHTLFGAAELLTPNYPDPYDKDCEITWIIQAEDSKILRLRIWSYQLDYPSDNLMIYVRNWTSPSRYYRIHREFIWWQYYRIHREFIWWQYYRLHPAYYWWNYDGLHPEDFPWHFFLDSSEWMVLPSGYAVLHFKSDKVTATQGFNISFSSINKTELPYIETYEESHTIRCSGVLQIPHRSDKSRSSMIITWHLQAELFKKIHLRFVNVHLEPAEDRLIIYEGSQKYFFAWFTGVVERRDIYFNNDFVLVQYVSSQRESDVRRLHIEFLSYDDSKNATSCSSAAVQECSLDNCQHGRCLNLPNGYTCSCYPGFTGSNCSEGIDECMSSPCINGRCIDMFLGYKCVCDGGYSGLNCDSDIDECDSNPCHFGQCVDELAAYRCNCTPGYTGATCAEAVQICSPDHCQHGRCLNLPNGYTCSCYPGFTGSNCSEGIDECRSSPCINGRCIDMSLGYKCVCDGGYSGLNCDSDIDECDSNPCHFGQCVNELAAYRCNCTPGYTGSTCSEDIDECLTKPCEHGVCSNDINAYRCSCDVGYSGDNCTTDLDDCHENTCLHGTCIDGINSYSCSCMPGYGGANCSEDLDECLSNPCKAGACTDLINDYSCTCHEGYTGKKCEIDIDDCASKPCFYGDCLDRVGRYMCNCFDGFSGKTCTQDVDECSSNPCLNGACLDRMRGYYCICNPGFTGLACEIAQVPTTSEKSSSTQFETTTVLGMQPEIRDQSAVEDFHGVWNVPWYNLIVTAVVAIVLTTTINICYFRRILLRSHYTEQRVQKIASQEITQDRTSTIQVTTGL